MSSFRQFLAGFPTQDPAEIQNRAPTGAISRVDLWFWADLLRGESRVPLFDPLPSTSRDQRRRDRQPRYAVENPGERVSRQGYLGQLERDGLGIPGDLSPDLDELFPQRRQRPVPYRVRQGQSPQEVAEVVVHARTARAVVGIFKHSLRFDSTTRHDTCTTSGRHRVEPRRQHRSI